jgi:hypothetical protein
MVEKYGLGCVWFATGFVVAVLCLGTVVLLGASTILNYIITIFF